MSTPWKGVFPAITTKFKEDLSLDYNAMERHVEAQLDGGVHGIVVTGTLGENGSLSFEEKQEVLRIVAEAVNGRVPVLMGIAETTTRRACQAVEDGMVNGADGFMVLPAMLYASDRRETMAHFRAVARASASPIAIATEGDVMTRRLISTGSPFEERIGYSRAVVADGWVFVAGTTGYDYETMDMPDNVEAQCRNALATIERALAEAGARMSDVVRVRYILPSASDWPACWPVTSAIFGVAKPAATMIVAGLQEPEMKIEIEVTARLPDSIA